MTSGAGLPVSSRKSILDALRRIDGEHYPPPEGPSGVALSIARACLAAGAADFITYESTEAKLEKASASAKLARIQKAPAANR